MSSGVGPIFLVLSFFFLRFRASCLLALLRALRCAAPSLCCRSRVLFLPSPSPWDCFPYPSPSRSVLVSVACRLLGSRACFVGLQCASSLSVRAAHFTSSGGCGAFFSSLSCLMITVAWRRILESVYEQTLDKVQAESAQTATGTISQRENEEEGSERLECCAKALEEGDLLERRGRGTRVGLLARHPSSSSYSDPCPCPCPCTSGSWCGAVLKSEPSACTAHSRRSRGRKCRS